MIGAERSLLSFLDMPVLVVDPEGTAAYANPAFEACFETPVAEIAGRPLAELFEGGGREALLRAVAEVCRYGESVRFRLRERDTGFAATASPIVAEDAHVGVVILLKEEVEGIERLIALHRELREPLDALGATLETLAAETVDSGQRARVEDAVGALERVRKWADHANAVICGAPTPEKERGEADPIALIDVALQRAEAEAGLRVERLHPPELPRVRGDARELGAILARLVKNRLGAEPRPPALCFTARHLEAESGPGDVVISIVELFPEHVSAPRLSPPALVKEVVAACGGALHVAAAPGAGRVTSIRLPVKS